MKKKIIFYGVNYFPAKGGTSTVVENLIYQLKDQYDITIYCYRHKLAKDHIPGVKAVEFKQLLPGSLGSLFYFLLSALHILFFRKAAIIHAHKTDCALFLPLLRLRFKIVATSHEAPYKRDKWNKIQKGYFRLAEWLFIRSANLCTSISKPLADYYHHKYKKEVFFIPNGINIVEGSQFDYARARSFLPPGATLDKPYLLFSARRLMSTKGCHTFLEALHKINYKGQVFVAGELKESQYLQKLKQLSNGIDLYFLDFVNPLNALLALVNKSLLFIFPSETEGMSIMLLEVASVGRPIIASAIPENTQIFSDRNVLYFQVNNADDLAKKIKHALDFPKVMDQFGASAQKHVYENFLWTEIARSYSLVYQKIAH